MASIAPLHLSDVLMPRGHPQAGACVPVLAFAVAHDGGVLLFDTGVGRGVAEIDEAFRPDRRLLSEELEAHGLDVSDVTAVANSHLHFDHCGLNRLFERVPLFVQRREYEGATTEGYTVREWVEFPDAAYEIVSGAVDVAPDVTLVPTPGHTRGHQSALVQTERGLCVLAGQAVYTVDEWNGSVDPRRSGFELADDPEAYADSVRRLHELEPAVVHFAHDRGTWLRGVSTGGPG
jgi:N-acyl homoserine lactone hydrolase